MSNVRMMEIWTHEIWKKRSSVMLTLLIIVIPIISILGMSNSAAASSTTSPIYYQPKQLGIVEEKLTIIFQDDGSALLYCEIEFYAYEESGRMNDIHLTFPGDFILSDIHATLENLRFFESINLTVKGYSSVKPHGVVLSMGEHHLEPRSRGILRIHLMVRHLVHRSLNPFSNTETISISLPCWEPDTVVGVSNLEVTIYLPFLADNTEIKGEYTSLHQEEGGTTVIFDKKKVDLNALREIELTIPKGRIDSIYPHTTEISIIILIISILLISFFLYPAFPSKECVKEYISPRLSLPIPSPTGALSVLQASVLLGYSPEIPVTIMLLSALKKGKLHLNSLSPLRFSKEKKEKNKSESNVEKEWTLPYHKNDFFHRLVMDRKKIFPEPPFRPQLLISQERLSRERVEAALLGIEKSVSDHINGIDVPATARLYRLAALTLQREIYISIPHHMERAEQWVEHALPLMLISPSAEDFLKRLKKKGIRCPPYLIPHNGKDNNFPENLTTLIDEIRKVIQPDPEEGREGKR